MTYVSKLLLFLFCVVVQAHAIECRAVVSEIKRTTTMDAVGDMHWVLQTLYFPASGETRAADISVTTLKTDTIAATLIKITTAIVDFGAAMGPDPCIVFRSNVLIPSYIRGV